MAFLAIVLISGPGLELFSGEFYGLFRLTIPAMTVRSRRMRDRVSLILRISSVMLSRTMSLTLMSVLLQSRIRSAAWLES
jgi:hypothetical protein